MRIKSGVVAERPTEQYPFWKINLDDGSTEYLTERQMKTRDACLFVGARLSLIFVANHARGEWIRYV